MSVTCFGGSASHLVGAHGARAVMVMIFEDLLYQANTHVTDVHKRSTPMCAAFVNVCQH